MGKGSTPRPIEVPREQFDNNFDAIFRKKKPQESPPTNGGNSPPAKY
jgi:hypothetical protein